MQTLTDFICLISEKISTLNSIKLEFNWIGMCAQCPVHHREMTIIFTLEAATYWQILFIKFNSITWNFVIAIECLKWIVFPTTISNWVLISFLAVFTWGWQLLKLKLSRKNVFAAKFIGQINWSQLLIYRILCLSSTWTRAEWREFDGILGFKRGAVEISL